MSRKALKVHVELKFRAVSCPGVHLPAKDDVYLSMCVMGQYCQSGSLPAVFPLLFHEEMTFEKIFRHAVDPGDIAVMLEYETVRIELVQLVPPAGDSLASFEEDARRFLFPEPRLVPSFSGVDREVLMTRAPYFPGIAPRLEFSTKTTIIECSAGAEISIYPSKPLRPVIKRNTKCRPGTSSPQRKQPQAPVSKQTVGVDGERHGTAVLPSRVPRSQSLPPLRAGSWKHSAAPVSAGPDAAGTSEAMMASWPGARRSHSPHSSAAFTSSSSPLIRSSSSVRFSPTGKRQSSSSGSIGGIAGHDPSDCFPYLSAPWQSKEQARPSRSHREWEEVHERVRRLLTTPKAVSRLLCGTTISEADQVLARRSLSPGPPR